MTTPSRTKNVLAGAAYVLAIAGCSQSGMNARPFSGAQAPNAQREGRHEYQILYQFGRLRDASAPNPNLLAVGNVLYGTSGDGGTFGISGGNGTAFSITTDGTEHVLHSFGHGFDGMFPEGGLTLLNGKLYGTTNAGGTHDSEGTVYVMDLAGRERVLHSFSDVNDGYFPQGSAVAVGGLLYGTTTAGGKHTSRGTIFTITPRGTERVLHSFGKSGDGAYPTSGLLDVAGTLYGTTCQGGDAYGDGTVFSITTSGRERVLHRFVRGTDGTCPSSALIELNGLLYGVTSKGGKYGFGTVFSITRGGKERVVFSFDQSNGSTPEGDLAAVDGVLYGTTARGGANDNAGAIFSLTPAGVETLLHSFNYRNDGRNPTDGLTAVDGRLYGTTLLGGRYGGGSDAGGTLFSLRP